MSFSNPFCQFDGKATLVDVGEVVAEVSELVVEGVELVEAAAEEEFETGEAEFWLFAVAVVVAVAVVAPEVG